MLIRRMFLVFLAVSIIVAGCAGVTIHDDLNVPPGMIEGNQFTGVRYPFKVEVPQNWKMATEFPDFLKEMGYDRRGPSDTEAGAVLAVLHFWWLVKSDLREPALYAGILAILLGWRVVRRLRNRPAAHGGDTRPA